MLTETRMKGKALLLTDDHGLLCSRRGQLVLYDADTGKIRHRWPLPMPGWKRTAVRIRLFERALHAEARWALQTGRDTVLLQADRAIYTLTLSTGKLTAETTDVRGKPLSACRIKGVPGFSDAVVFGDYGGNDERQPVRVFARRDGSTDWTIAYTFPAGTVRHIHGFCPDEKRGCLYILTGDKDAESGIWTARDDFRTVEPLRIGTQQYRACRMQLLPDGGILYLTDAPSEPNHVMRLTADGAEPVQDLPGSCIYGRKTPDGGIYSTVCEPDAEAPNRLAYFLTNRPGKGIASRRTEVFRLNDAGEKETIASFTHDGLPLRLFQYGTVTFAEGGGDEIYCTAQCVKRYDERIFRFRSGIYQ